ncbi:D-serine ammonia-lyase [Campylobacter canadensis]|uniref:D-serine ammonia-lyase n=1 Tax=Campylobacter canadensis TaxID=449520 RepID=UPI001CCBB9B7|nr:D-serine ammonia-lyase [Campylobacter canadensis]MBZ7999796.1 D-serine ammonia-lyase [Campylobacter canadensis]MBZ8001723.1 D-serine ammonia-lyase [Campylobacter canadensis]
MLIDDLKAMKETSWLNDNLASNVLEELNNSAIKLEQIEQARARLNRFAPLLKILFPSTNATNGIIESPLHCANFFKQELEKLHKCKINKDLYIKLDSHLPISGSIKARGGIYEVLKHAEDLLIQNNLLNTNDDYSKIIKHKDFLSKYKIAVGSTGNLGLSIGIMSAKLGFKVDVHMSNCAKEWKKRMLKEHGCNVITYDSDYGVAVEQGRKNAQNDPFCYFIDDENSHNLFLGYSVAAKRLKAQFEALDITINENRPLYVYLPCGVGGGPGGVAYGLKSVFANNVKCFFAEPTHSPCMVLGLATKKHEQICVADIGLDNITAADGLAVGRASSLVGKVLERVIDGFFTVSDENMYRYLGLLAQSENIKLEPSALAGVRALSIADELKLNNENAIHLIWATGGNMVPDDEMNEYLKTAKGLL